MAGVSFFIPAYNCSATIAEAVRSIMKTNFFAGDELLIVNDFSTDNTAEVLKQLQIKYPQLNIITHTLNKGGAAARNTAVQSAKNELLFCLDADNVLANNCIKPLKTILLKENADIASFEEMRYFNSSNCNKTQYTWRFLPVTTFADFMIDNKNPGSSGNYLFSKQSWIKAGGYPEFAGALDTWGFCFRQLASGAKLISLPGSYYFHRYGTSSYYIREMAAKNMSLIALQIITPYKDLINSDDFNYISNTEHKFTWFEDFNLRPIRLATGEVGAKALQIYPQRHGAIYKLAHKIYTTLKSHLFEND